LKYVVYYDARAAKELAKIDRPFQILIKRRIEQSAENFQSTAANLKPLKGKYDYYRLRVGSYRVVFHKDEGLLIITIVRLGHRKNIYRDFD